LFLQVRTFSRLRATSAWCQERSCAGSRSSDRVRPEAELRPITALCPKQTCTDPTHPLLGGSAGAANSLSTAPTGRAERKLRRSLPRSVREADVVLGECRLGRVGAREKLELGAPNTSVEAAVLREAVEQPRHPPGKPLGQPDPGKRPVGIAVEP